MALTNGQIISLCCQEAKIPRYTVQAAAFLNAILSELCQDYDLAASRGIYNFNFNPGLVNVLPQQQLYGSGPYTLPADYLRTSGSSGSNPQKSVWWVQFGQTYFAYPVDLSEFDEQTQQAGLQSFPYWFATDMSQTPPVSYFYPPPNGAFPVTMRYQRQMPDLATDTFGNLTGTAAAAVPWFPNTNYLRRRLTGELMGLSGDDRMPQYLGDNDELSPLGAGVLLRKWLILKDDSSNRAKRVSLDRRRYGKRWDVLPYTKVFGF